MWLHLRLIHFVAVQNDIKNNLLVWLYKTVYPFVILEGAIYSMHTALKIFKSKQTWSTSHMCDFDNEPVKVRYIHSAASGWICLAWMWWWCEWKSFHPKILSRWKFVLPDGHLKRCTCKHSTYCMSSCVAM